VQPPNSLGSTPPHDNSQPSPHPQPLKPPQAVAGASNPALPSRTRVDRRHSNGGAPSGGAGHTPVPCPPCRRPKTLLFSDCANYRAGTERRQRPWDRGCCSALYHIMLHHTGAPSACRGFFHHVCPGRTHFRNLVIYFLNCIKWGVGETEKSKFPQSTIVTTSQFIEVTTMSSRTVICIACLVLGVFFYFHKAEKATDGAERLRAALRTDTFLPAVTDGLQETYTCAGCCMEGAWVCVCVAPVQIIFDTLPAHRKQVRWTAATRSTSRADCP
jgi:hypothetical protein